MIKLINREDCIERRLVTLGLERFSETHEGLLVSLPDLYIYGGGTFVPGENFDGLIEAHQKGVLLGLCALRLSESVVTSLSADLRAAIGTVLRLAPMSYCVDQLSVEWSPHFAFPGVIGSHPGWLAAANFAGMLEQDFENCSVIVARDVGKAMLAALFGKAAVLYAEHDWRNTPHNEYLELVRWAQENNASLWVVHDEARAEIVMAQLMRNPLPIIPAAVVASKAVAAERLLEKMVEGWMEKNQARSNPTAENILASLGVTKSVAVPAGNGPRELVLGTVFDPATHYTAEYFDGRGFIYTKPDGVKDVYHGPGYDWEGFRFAAEMMRDVLRLEKVGTKLVDLGCGSGAFVRQARTVGFDVQGFDISEAAIAAAGPDVRGQLLHVDITKTHPSEICDVVTALDFWEHIFFETDLDPLIEDVRRMLVPGGIGFFIICTRGAGEKDYTIKRGDVFTKDNSWLLCSGHVTIRRLGWWAQQFKDHGFKIRADLAYYFQVLRDEEPGFSKVDSWRSKNLLIVQREG